MRLSAALLGSLLLGVGCALTPEPPHAHSQPDWSLSSARIVFNGRQHGSSELYLHDVATGKTKQLTRMAEQQMGANGVALSPDGRTIVFQGTRSGDYDLFLQNLAAGEPRPFEVHPSYEVLPQWSPDGKEIAFMSTRGLQRGEFGPFPGHLYAKQINGGAMRQLTHQPLGSSLGPTSWSPDGKTLLLAREHEDSLDIFRLEVASGLETRISSGEADEYSADYSHDGQLITFHAETDSEAQIVVSNADGSGQRLLTTGPGYRYYPRWSPDDRWVIYSYSDDGQQYDLRVVPAGGGDERDLLATTMDEREARFVP